MSRPELGEITVGDRVLVIDKSNRETRTFDATVTNAGPVWLTLTAGNTYSATWRMRRDTQNTGDRNRTPTERFVTPEQHMWETRQTSAFEFLSSIGIRVERGSKFALDRVTLANLIRRHDGMTEL